MSAELSPQRPLTVIDAWKALALLLILIDHLGHYLFPETPLFRVIGRLGLPVFFFLVGYARVRAIPLRWLAIGLVLTAVDYLWTGQQGMPLINILFSFAVFRLALPVIERFFLAPPWRLLVLMAVLVVLMPLFNPLVEYGTEGWLLGLSGLALRRHHEDNQAFARHWPGLVAVISGVVFILVEARDYAFSTGHTGILTVGSGFILAGLMHFRRVDLGWQPEGALAQILRFCGRYNLEIYAAQIILFAALGGALSSLNLIETRTDD